MQLKNEAMLITYADSLGNNLKDLAKVLQGPLKDVVGGVHILPFFPSSGDRGFAPMDYTKVDPSFGNWEDIRALAENYYLMFDFMVNHISAQSPYFKDFLAKKDQSEYADLFIRYKNFWPNGKPTQEQVDLIYKRKPRAPYRIAEFADGTQEKVWCTFDEEQVDLDVTTPTTKKFIKNNLEFLSKQGASIIRLDAFAYANKKIGTNCFFIEPEIWKTLRECTDVLDAHNVAVLPEIHEHYTIQLKIAEHGYYVYDFALPMLVLHTLFSSRVDRLVHWMEICPRKQFTTLDTHDGIGVVDVKDLMTDEETEAAREALYAQGANVKKKYSSAEYNNLDIYQINCTYYSALGNDDQAYLLARVLQCFAPGIPQIYYVGLLAGENDIELLEKTKEGRNINRHYYTLEEIEAAVQRPVVQRLFGLLKFRNTSKAFDGEFSVKALNENTIEITWNNTAEKISTKMTANICNKTFTIIETVNGKDHEIKI
ncbi:sugar phosphorylase [Neisseria arctica]|uniref:Sugar phosphorylase n=1 Tax=Neisseria arctica TaxID=1470200 RepID=A0A0J0YU13_9NEIS|nr:sucrose phosphorylase [Neisseria arctica]KLT73604.1 sugar phosphorylase [Neisseria arctica]UOO85726.1 sucrose phosphorylase [Neisseria arctica]